MSKGGIVGLTRALAIELAPDVHVNAVAPGLIATEMAMGIPDDIRTRMIQAIPMKRMGEPTDVAGLVAFLVSFENFNTTLMLVGSDAPLTITMYDRMVKVGSTPVLNAVSFFLMVGSGGLALLSIIVQRDKAARQS